MSSLRGKHSMEDYIAYERWLSNNNEPSFEAYHGITDHEWPDDDWNDYMVEIMGGEEWLTDEEREVFGRD